MTWQLCQVIVQLCVAKCIQIFSSLVLLSYTFNFIFFLFVKAFLKWFAHWMLRAAKVEIPTFRWTNRRVGACMNLYGLTAKMKEIIVDSTRISAQNLFFKSSLGLFSFFVFFLFRPGAETQAWGANYHTETALVIIDWGNARHLLMNMKHSTVHFQMALLS